ncbi:urea ABC transporter permease subunit UrtC [Nesterenkonia cremea]|uniref:ABC transporter permease n=1 Tax=Nesterenkonia cremea TaxID=1882340 RepID=A0A917ERJ4_9MICC|nr:urea ABC transporter permease subunit UrtC [Nesterenkonia cremea]GGE70914.1 ABC transporter permease [Nesterenkonia cremea]
MSTTATQKKTGRLARISAAGTSPGVPSPRTAYLGIALIAMGLLVLAPALLTPFELRQMGRFVCYAMVAVGIGLAWGRGGMLTLGQGVFFGIGAYCMAMHMQLEDAALRGEETPQFMGTFGVDLPWFWEPFHSPLMTILLILLLPAALAFALGYSVFKRKVRGAYFAILNQAMVFAFVTLLVGQQATLNGSNGLSGFESFFGFAIHDPANRQMIYMIAAALLVIMMLVAYWMMRSRFGELLVATRDAEERVRFLGYDPAIIKTITFVTAAVMASVAGAMFVPLVGIISPAELGVVPSIAFVIGVAIGGRATLFGPVLGAIAVAWAESTLAENFPSGWTYFQGLLLILVIALLPGGIASVGRYLRWKHRGEAGKPTSEDPAPSDPATSDPESENSQKEAAS